MSFPSLDRNRAPRRAKGLRWHDEARFIKTWLENPRGTGAVSPSGRSLSRAIAKQVDPAIDGPVVELGPGTGPVTDALIRRGIAPERLILIEYEAAFCRLLARRYPQCRVIQGDAYALAHTLGPILSRPAAAIVSSLPLLNRPEWERFTLLGDAFALMEDGSPFVQFTYGLASPIPRHVGAASVSFDARVTAPVWLNLPPARVWTYRSAARRADLAERRDFMDKLRLGGEKLGDEWREQRERLRAEWVARSAEAKAEWLVRSAEAKAEWRARTQKVRAGLASHRARVKAARQTRIREPASMGDDRGR